MSDWISSVQACCILDVDMSTIYDARRLGFRQGVRCQRGGKGRGGGLRWSREDCKAVRKIMDACRLNCHQAARVLSAKREDLL